MFPDSYVQPEPWFLRPRSCDQPEIVTDAAFELIAEGGTAALTMRALARHTRMSPAWLSDRFTNRARMLAIITRVFGVRWTWWIQARLRPLGLGALLPNDDESVVATRVWLALVELGRVDDGVALRVADVRREERAIVTVLLGRAPDVDQVDATVALVEGLRAMTADPLRPLSPARAGAILRAGCSR